MKEGTQRNKGFRPAQKLFAGLSATALILLWWQLLSDFDHQYATTSSRSPQSNGEAEINPKHIKIRDVDLGPKVESLRASIEAADLIYSRCSQSGISTLEACFGEIFNEQYYSSRTLLPIAEALSLAQGQAKEVTYTLTSPNQGKPWEAEQQEKFYCLNPALSSTEASMWTTIIESDEALELTRHLSKEAKDKICQEQAQF
jgi:hypothetical protein